MMRAAFLLAGFALSTLPALSQAPSPQLSFEVASVKPVDPDAPASPMDHLMRGPMAMQMRFRGGPGTNDPGRIDCTGVTISLLLQRAYELRPDQISGPDWLDSLRYNISAKVPPGATAADVRLMFQDLLATRFAVRLHRETKTLPVYYLTVARGGHKLSPPIKAEEYKDEEERKQAMRKKAEAAMQAMQERIRAGTLTTNRSFHHDSATTEKLAEALSAQTDRPVKDRTGLDGLYSFTLKWLAEGAPVREDVTPGPSIFAAVEEQLGLHLQPAKEPVEIFIVDHAGKVPTAN